MKRSIGGFKVLGVSLGVCVLCAGLVLFGTGCPGPDLGCTANADCDDGLYCTGTETCANGICTDGTSPCAAGQECVEESDSCVAPACESDADCEEGEFCDTQTGECTVNQNVYAVTKVDADYAERVHYDFEQSVHTTCTVCHHAADTDAGVPDAANMGCETCHPDDPNEVNSFKDVAHDANESGDGCRMCHDAEFTGNCAFCHPDAP